MKERFEKFADKFKKITDNPIGGCLTYIFTILALVILVGICSPIVEFIYNIPGSIRWIVSNGNDISLAEPWAYNFSIVSDDEPSETYEVSEFDTYEGCYHVFVDRKYLNNDDVSLYITGSYWNYPKRPTIKMNGILMDDVSQENYGYANLFGDIYFDKIYHLTYENRIEQGKVYEIYVRCDDVSKTANVVFHDKKDEEYIRRALSWGAWYVENGELKGRLNSDIDILGTYQCFYMNDDGELDVAYWKFTKDKIYMSRSETFNYSDDLYYVLASDDQEKTVLYRGEDPYSRTKCEIVEFSETGFKVIIENETFVMTKIK